MQIGFLIKLFFPVVLDGERVSRVTHELFSHGFLGTCCVNVCVF